MRYARLALLSAAAVCSMAIATPAPAQAASTAASAYSNSAAGAPKMRQARRRFIPAPDAATAPIHPQRPPGYGSMQAPIGHRQPTQDDLQPTQDDLKNIDKDNHELNLPASQDDITGAGQVQSGEDALTKRIGQDNSRLDRQIREICPSCGGAEVAPPVHRRAWPVHNGFNHQPSQDELRALHQQDVTSDQAHEIDRLYDQLMSSSDRMLRRHPAGAP
jgi:hypothetical protein